MAIVNSDGSDVLTRNQLVPSHGLLAEPPSTSFSETVYSLRHCVNENIMKEALQPLTQLPPRHHMEAAIGD
ncbi:hypothetical protein E2C01_035170 [Portunus trituberculatus]|uniref:Uncharacterized protein n=1 Tax=Portunus trituberculatus TaxID=210409 RepID=A0A5B7F3H6_PORTR|nr:hypothetical protein [Portunus trituberculatus]